MSRYYVEFAGTFLFVLTIGLVSLSPLPPWIASLAIASALVAVTFTGGHVSGAHYNPAVSFAYYLRGSLPRDRVRGYLGAQIGAAIAGGFLAVLIRGGAAVTTSLYSAWLPAATAEFVFTFTLVWVVLNAGLSGDRRPTTMGPLAVGLVVLAGFISVGDIYRAAFNPAVALSIALTQTGEWVDLAVYLAAQLGGAAAAALAFDHLQPEIEESSADNALPRDSPVASPAEEPAATTGPLI